MLLRSRRLDSVTRDRLLERELDKGGQLCLRPPPQAAPWMFSHSFLRERPVFPFTGRSALWPGATVPVELRRFDAPRLAGEARLVAYIVLCVSGSGASSEASGSAMNQVRNGDVSRDSAVGATLGELAEKLSELREHLDQILAGLSDSREDDGGIRDATPAASRRRFGQASAEGLRCHECGRRSSTDQAGWTLRLCGDDQLHPFCPACDRRPVSGNGGAGPTSAGLRSSQALAGGGR